MSVIPLSSVTFQHPVKVGHTMMTGTSVGSTQPPAYRIEFDGVRLVCITHMSSKRVVLVPLSNVAGMEPAITG